jgi:hypothetical protein
MTCIDDFIRALPSLKDIRQIVLNKQFTKKDSVPMKLVIDIFEQYYSVLFSNDEVYFALI